MAGVVALAAGPAGAAGDTTAQAECAEPGNGPVAVVEVDGLLDPVLVDFIEDQVHAAERACAVALVLQLDSGGAVVSDGELDDLVATIEDSSVPVDVWIGPSGSKATDEAVRLVAAAGVTGIAPGSSIEATPTLLDARGVDPGDLGTVGVGDRVGAGRAVELDLVDSDAPVIGQFVVELPGVETEVVGGDRRIADTQEVQFGGLSLVGQLMHTVASPAVAYLLFVIGLALLLFELYTAGVGIAGMVGAGALILGCYGLAVLPTRPIGVALLLLAMFGYAVDVQTGVPRLWTGDRHRELRARFAAAVRRALGELDHAAGGVRRDDVGDVRRHAHDGPHPLLDADHRPGVDDRRARRGAYRHRARRRDHIAGRSVAGAHQPRHADPPARASARGSDRGPRAGSGAGGWRGARLPRAQTLQRLTYRFRAPPWAPVYLGLDNTGVILPKQTVTASSHASDQR